MKNKKKKKIGRKLVHSDFEYELYHEIKNSLPPGYKIEYEPEKIKYVIEAEYTPDFVITAKDGSKMYIEAKGNGRQFDNNVRRKMISVKEQHPDKDIRIIFYNDGKCGPKRKNGTFMRQSDWAAKHKFIFSIRNWVKEWLDGGK